MEMLLVQQPSVDGVAVYRGRGAKVVQLSPLEMAFCGSVLGRLIGHYASPTLPGYRGGKGGVRQGAGRVTVQRFGPTQQPKQSVP